MIPLETGKLYYYENEKDAITKTDLIRILRCSKINSYEHIYDIYSFTQDKEFRWQMGDYFAKKHLREIRNMQELYACLL